MADNEFILDFIAKVTPDKKSIYSLKKDIKKATGLMDTYNNTVEMKEMSASNRRHNQARTRSKQLADNIINDWKSRNIDITSLMGLSPQELDKSFDKVHKTFNKNAKKMQSDLSKAEKANTKIIVDEAEKQIKAKEKVISYGSKKISKAELSAMQAGGQTVAGNTYGAVQKGNIVYDAYGNEKSYVLTSKTRDINGDILTLKRKILQTENEINHVEDSVITDSSERLQLEKKVTQEKKEQIALDKHIASLQAKGASYGNTTTSGKVIKTKELSTNGLPEGIKRISEEVDIGHNKFVQYESIIDKTGKTLAKHQTGLREATRDHKTFAGQMKIATQRIFEWGVATSMVYGTLRQLKEGIGFVVELDNKMNEVRMVTGATADEAKRLSQEYNNLASQMGVTTMDVANMANEFYRQGLGQEETNNRMKETIKYAKIAGMTTQETAEIITASANSYGFAGEEISTMVDQLSYLGDASAANSAEVGRAMQRVASTAKNTGMSYSKLGSIIATISETTRESAQSIGNSVKSIMVRYSSLKPKGAKSGEYNEVVKSLKLVGINALDAKKNLRSFTDVYDEVGKKWDKMSDRNKALVTTSMAGAYQANRLVTAFSNYGRSMELYEGALDSAGNAQKKFDISLESTESKINKFKASTEKMWMNLINSEDVKSIIDFGTKMMETVDKVGALNLVLSGLSTILVMKVIPSVIAFGIELATAEGAAEALALVFGTLNPIMLLLGLVVAGVTLEFFKWRTEVKKAEEDLKRYTDLKKDLVSLEEEYKNVSESSMDESVKYERLLEIQKRINDNNKEAILVSVEHNNLIKEKERLEKSLLDLEDKKRIATTEDEQRAILEQIIQDKKDLLNIEDKLGKEESDRINKSKSKNKELYDMKMKILSNEKTELSVFFKYSEDLNTQEIDSLINKYGKYKSNEINLTKIKVLEAEKRVRAIEAEILAMETLATVYSATKEKAEKSKYGDTDAPDSIFKKYDFSGIKEAKKGLDEAKALLNLAKDTGSGGGGGGGGGGGSKKQLNDYLKDEQKYLNEIAKAENVLKGLTSDQRKEKIAGIEVEKKEQQDLINYYKKLLPTIKDKDKVNEKKMKAELEGKIIDTQGKIASLSKDILETQMEITDEAKKQTEELAKQREELVKKQEEALKNILELTEKMIEQEKKDAVDALKDQIDKYDEIISQKKKIIDLTESQRDYENELVDKQKSVSDIQDDIAVLSLDSSRESIAKRLELESELKDKQKELNEYQHDRNIELQQNALDTELDSYKKTKESEIKTLEDYLNNAGKLSADAMALINSQSDTVYQSLLKWNQQYGTSIDKDITDAWKNASAAISDYKTKLGGFDIGGALNSISNELNPSLSKNNASLLPNLGDLGKSDLWNNTAKNIVAMGTSQINSAYNNTSTIGGGLNIDTLVKVEGNATTETIEKIKTVANDIVTDINNSLRLRGNGRTAGTFA